MFNVARIAFVFMLFVVATWVGTAHAEFSSATRHSPPKACPAGSFWDPRNGGECWACPAEYLRSGTAVTDPKACYTKATESLAAATRGTDLGCAKGTKDLTLPICFSCDEGYNRSVFSVQASNACHQPASEEFRATSHYRDNTSVGQGCPDGYFWDAKQKGDHGFPRNTMGACYKDCPGRFKRTGHSVTSSRACARTVSEDWKPANIHAPPKVACGPNEFQHLLTGQCWSCPAGYNRTANPIGGSQACSKLNPETYQSATFKSRFAILTPCGAGQFYDLATATCWSCPSNHFRTINPVGHARACTNQPMDFFAADPQALCVAIIDGIKTGKEGMDKVALLLKPVLDTVRVPLQRAADDIASKVRTPAEFDRIVNDVTSRLNGPVFDTAVDFQTRFRNAGYRVDNLLLDSNIMCSGNEQLIRRALRELDLRPSIPSIPESNVYLSLGVGASFVEPQYRVGYTVSLSVATNFVSGTGIFISMGPQTSTSVGPSGSVGGMIFPKITLADFGPSAIPGIGISVGAGDKIAAFYQKAGSLGKVLPNSLDFSIDPSFRTIPGIGVSKGFGGKGLAYVDISGNATWTFPIQTWGR